MSFGRIVMGSIGYGLKVLIVIGFIGSRMSRNVANAGGWAQLAVWVSVPSLSMWLSLRTS